MKTCNRILLVLGIPPPYGGGEIQSELVINRFCNHPDFYIYSYSRKRGSKSTQGRATAGNLLFGLTYIVRCCGLIVRLRPAKMFLSIPKNLGAFARMIPVILFASIMRVKVCGELAGARFLFLDRGWQKVLGLFVFRHLHSIRFLGDHVKDAHEAYGLRNPVVFANGIRIPEDRSHVDHPGEGKLHLLAVGALNRSKGTGRVIEAVSLCRDRGLDISCTLVGEWSDPSLKEEMEQFITLHRLEEHIHFTGLIKGDQKWDYFRNSEILVHPTDWDGQPLTILEAIGMGLAVISAPVGAIPDTVDEGKNGVLLKENTPEKLYEAIHAMYVDRERLKHMMDYNRADFDRRFTVENYLENLRNWLETV